MGQKKLLFFNTFTARRSTLNGKYLISNCKNLNCVSNNKHCKYHCVVLSSFGQTNQLTLYSDDPNMGLVIQIYSDVSGIWVTLTVFYFMSKYKSITSDFMRWILTNSLFTRSHSACEHLRSSARTRSDPWTRSSLCWNVRPELSFRTSRATRPEAVAS